MGNKEVVIDKLKYYGSSSGGSPQLASALIYIIEKLEGLSTPPTGAVSGGSGEDQSPVIDEGEEKVLCHFCVGAGSVRLQGLDGITNIVMCPKCEGSGVEHPSPQESKEDVSSGELLEQSVYELLSPHQHYLMNKEDRDEEIKAVMGWHKKEIADLKRQLDQEKERATNNFLTQCRVVDAKEKEIAELKRQLGQKEAKYKVLEHAATELRIAHDDLEKKLDITDAFLNQANAEVKEAEAENARFRSQVVQWPSLPDFSQWLVDTFYNKTDVVYAAAQMKGAEVTLDWLRSRTLSNTMKEQNTKEGYESMPQH